MAVKFLAGRARSGKTETIIREIARACRADPLGSPQIWIVPEQAAYSAERMLLERGALACYSRAQVLSFTRLQEYVFANSPAPARERLKPAHRDLLVTMLVAKERRERPDSLLSALGMEEALSDFVSESKQYAQRPEDLRRALSAIRAQGAAAGPAGVSGLLKTKLESLARMLEEYNRAVSERFEDPQDTLLSLAEVIERGDLFQAADVYIDGFIGYTPVEERVLTSLAKRARNLTIAIQADPSRIAEIHGGVVSTRHPIFSPAEETYTRLRRLFDAAGCDLTEPVLLKNDRVKDAGSALLHIEHTFLSRKEERAEPSAEVQFLEAANPREEVRAAAEILSQWMSEHDWRPEDVGILTRDLDLYAPYIQEQFRFLKIPVFIDRSEPLAHHPIVSGLRQLIRCALFPFDADSLLEFAKTGYLPVSRRAVDYLQRYVRQYPMPAHAWYQSEPWPAPPARNFFDDEESSESGTGPANRADPLIDETRKAIAFEVQRFRDSFLYVQHSSPMKVELRPFFDPPPPPKRKSRKKPAPPAGTEELDLFSGLTKAVDENGREAEEHLEMIERREEGALRVFVRGLAESLQRVMKERAIPEEDAPILRQTGELLGHAAEASGEEPVSWFLAGDMINRALSRLSLPRIPPMLGEAFAGQVDRSRQPHLKGVAVLGLSEGMFPRLGTNMTLLNDSERDLLADTGLELRPNTRKQFDREALFAYRAITSATERLALIRPRARRDGSPANPSPFFRDLRARFCFPEEELPPEPAPRDDLSRCYQKRELAAAALRQLDQTHLRAFSRSRLRAEELFNPIAGRQIKALTAEALYKNEVRLPADVFADYTKKKLRVSVSQMESYHKCPFQRFVRYTLRPQELMKPEFDFPDAGNYGHAVLKNFTALLRREGAVGKLLGEQEFERLYAEASATPRQLLDRSGLLSSASGKVRLEKMDAVIQETAAYLVAYFAHSKVTPLHEELTMGSEELPPLSFSLEDGWTVELRGQIDRIDKNRNGDIIVVDYKLNEKSFLFQPWESGENLQLPVYLIAVNEAKLGKPGGGLYLGLVHREETKPRRYKGVMRATCFERTDPTASYFRGEFIQGAQGDPKEKPRAWGTAIDDSEFKQMLRRTGAKIRETAARIASGDTAVAPSRRDAMTACTYCSYRGICHIDYTVNSARERLSRKRETILQELRDAENGD